MVIKFDRMNKRGWGRVSSVAPKNHIAISWGGKNEELPSEDNKILIRGVQEESV